jgi:hypothetical protein
MRKFTTVEQAYDELAASCIDFVRGREWNLAICRTQLFAKMAQVENSLIWNSSRVTDGVDWPDSSISPGRAALFLRDDLLNTTGQRIWGFAFTLYPDGKFNIEYDYNKPEGYEETDDVITGDEINASLGQLMGKGSADS